ncbi:metallophosphoesterase family protein [Lewinella sp. W8]|uniref:metallophosphoesterase family protein n=1 Tax=Lewinella sp. W8 TaxID=2528208 RepID=UPI0010684017|nr:metallophosphoesterase family protein [Lewinella sp. W8]MTB52563.1 serine/threonine protein phosphatase [Lewinella sp. W8]
MARFAISDLHGCRQTFLAALDTIGLNKDDELFLLGDYIDRGPDSKGVIDTIWELERDGYRVQCLKGNHEQMCLDGTKDPNWLPIWLKNGGRETMGSFGDHMPDEQHLQWMEALPHYLETPGYILTHAGLNFRRANPMEDQDAMLWIRRWSQEVDRDWLNGRIIVHGHTPRTLSEIKENLAYLNHLPVMNIDAGCCYDLPGRGNLCVFHLDDQRVTFMPNRDR